SPSPTSSRRSPSRGRRDGGALPAGRRRFAYAPCSWFLCSSCFLDLDLELGLEHLRQRDHLRLTLLARHRHPAAAAGVEAGEAGDDGLLALARRLDGDARQPTGEAAVV